MTPRQFPPRWPAAGLLLVALVAILIATPAWAAAQGGRAHHAQAPVRVPQGFLGTVLGGPVFPDMASTSVLGSQLDTMVSSGVESVRAVFEWAATQPYPTWSQVPAAQQSQFSSDGVDNVPTNWTNLDYLVAAAASRGLSLLPVVIGAPSWDGRYYPGASVAIPRGDSGYADFCKALVRRYGHGGTFWQAYSPIAPITAWQIWNEPNVWAFWPQRPFATHYVSLLRAARSAIRSADPKAQIVLAGLANYSWSSLRAIYQVPGARGLFDVVGLHPYTRSPLGVVTILGRARQVMLHYGDSAKPMIADEISWPSSRGKTGHDTGYDFATTEAGQARDVSAVIPLLVAARLKLKLRAVYYYTWATIEVPNGLAFSYAGLNKYVGDQFVRKPVFYAYRRAALVAERCHVKATTATACAKPY